MISLQSRQDVSVSTRRFTTAGIGLDNMRTCRYWDSRLSMEDSENIRLILAELRKIAAWAEMQRKISKWMLIAMAIFIPVIVVIGVVTERKVKTELDEIRTVERPDWYDVDRCMRLGEFDKAIRLGEELIARTPQYPEGHRRLATAYLAAGKLEKAREHYAEAFRLFPSDENQRVLAVIERRLRSSTSQPNQSGDSADLSPQH